MQTPKGNILKFQKQTNSFQLTGCLTDEKLVVTLKDYTDWCIYEHQFTQENIGKQIHRKLQLIDVYSSLCENNSNQHQINLQTTKGKSSQENYFSGQLVCSQGKPKYKIERDGKITTYTQINFRRNNEQVEQTFQSHLNLLKVKQMSQIQILMAKNGTQKRELVGKIQQKIDKLINQNVELKQKVASLELSNEQCRYKIEKLSQIVMKRQKEQNEMKQGMSLIKKQLAELRKKAEPVKLEFTHYGKFNQNHNTISYVGEACSFTQLFIKEQIPFNKMYIFKLKIIKTNGRNIMIGICDYEKQKSNRTSYSSGNAVAYYGPGGYLYPGSQQTGAGFKQSDVIQVAVSLSGQKITWAVNGSLTATSNQSIISQQYRKFLPYIEFYEQQQTIEWLGSTII